MKLGVLSGDVVDEVDLFPTGVSRPGSILNPIKGSSARYARRGQCPWRSVPFAGHLKDLHIRNLVDVVSPCLHLVFAG